MEASACPLPSARKAGALFDLSEVHVLAVERDPSSFTVVVDTVPSPMGCPKSEVLATGHDRRSGARSYPAVARHKPTTDHPCSIVNA